jgi:hypothetical protein
MLARVSSTFVMTASKSARRAGAGLTLNSVASRKHHRNAGDFDIDLPTMDQALKAVG